VRLLTYAYAYIILYINNFPNGYLVADRLNIHFVKDNIVDLHFACFFVLVQLIELTLTEICHVYIDVCVTAWHILSGEGTAVDAILAGGTSCEEQPCAASVGYGGSPDEHGETALDAMIMDG